MKNVLLLLTVAIALSACTPTPTPEPGPTPNPAPTPTPTPKPLFIPIPGALVGSGDGTKEGTVYVSPTADEIEVMKLVNEVRTKGTVNGVPATAGTCVDGTWKALPALTYNGLFAYASRKHAEYMSNVGYEGHAETNTSSTYFYGSNAFERVTRAYKELTNIASLQPGEVVGTGRSTPVKIVEDWLSSNSHCVILFNTNVQQFGVGEATGPIDTAQNRWGRSWALIVR